MKRQLQHWVASVAQSPTKSRRKHCCPLCLPAQHMLCQVARTALTLYTSTRHTATDPPTHPDANKRHTPCQHPHHHQHQAHARTPTTPTQPVSGWSQRGRGDQPPTINTVNQIWKIRTGTHTHTLTHSPHAHGPAQARTYSRTHTHAHMHIHTHTRTRTRTHTPPCFTRSQSRCNEARSMCSHTPLCTHTPCDMTTLTVTPHRHTRPRQGNNVPSY
jgi:hypothetical protein